MFCIQRSSSWQGSLQPRPLTTDPSTDKGNRRNDGHNKNTKQHGVFDEGGAVFIASQLLNKTLCFRHALNPFTLLHTLQRTLR